MNNESALGFKATLIAAVAASALLRDACQEPVDFQRPPDTVQTPPLQEAPHPVLNEAQKETRFEVTSTLPSLSPDKVEAFLDGNCRLNDPDLGTFLGTLGAFDPSLVDKYVQAQSLICKDKEVETAAHTR